MRFGCLAEREKTFSRINKHPCVSPSQLFFLLSISVMLVHFSPAIRFPLRHCHGFTNSPCHSPRLDARAVSS